MSEIDELRAQVAALEARLAQPDNPYKQRQDAALGQARAAAMAEARLERSLASGDGFDRANTLTALESVRLAGLGMVEEIAVEVFGAADGFDRAAREAGF